MNMVIESLGNLQLSQFLNLKIHVSRVPTPVISVSVIPVFHINIWQGPPAGITEKSPLQGPPAGIKIIKTGITVVGTRGAGTSEFRDNRNWDN
jgi:hypothetical protein